MNIWACFCDALSRGDGRFIGQFQGILYFVFFENRTEAPTSIMPMAQGMPMVDVLIPCFNEEDDLEDSIPHLLKLNYRTMNWCLSTTAAAMPHWKSSKNGRRAETKNRGLDAKQFPAKPRR